MILNQNFREFIALLNANHVDYLLVGGYAVVFHGYPRLTGDMDIWVRPDKENAPRIIRALAEFGFASLGLRAEDFTSENNIVQFGYPPLRIDVMTAIDGVNFEECFARRLVSDVSGITVNVIHLDDLKTNKRSTGRFKDLNDIEHL